MKYEFMKNIEWYNISTQKPKVSEVKIMFKYYEVERTGFYGFYFLLSIFNRELFRFIQNLIFNV